MSKKFEKNFAACKKLTVFILLLLLGAGGYSQQQKISGRVTHANDGSGIADVSVHIKGSTEGSITDPSGAFQITAPAGSTLVFSHINYISKEVRVDARAGTYNIQLEPLSESMDNVVVIGYGSQQKRDLTGSIYTVPLGQVKDLPVPSIDQKLIGQVPGVQVSAVTGTPGGGASIKIRGSGSIGAGNDPLFVIDGFLISNSFGQTTNPLNLLSPDDIESITVLKDASSTAIYGSRGANGVVVVTTKHGKKGPPQVSVSTFYGLQQVPQKKRPELLNATQFAQFQKEKIIDRFASQGLVATDDDIPEAYRNPSQYGEGTDWYNTVLRTAPQYSVHSSVRGGNEHSRYSVSGSYYNQEGTLRYTGFERYTVRGNFDVNITPRFKVGVNLSPTFYTQNINDFEVGNRDVLAKSIFLSPLVPVTDATGKRTVFIQSPGTFGAPNPLNSLEFAGTKVNNFNGLGNAYAEYEIIKGLKARYSISVNYTEMSSFTFNPSWIGGLNTPPPAITNSSTQKIRAFDWLSEGLINYKTDIGKLHTIDAMLGYTTQRKRSDTLKLTANQYPDDLIETINAAAFIPAFDQSIQEWAVISYLARVNYSFDNRFLLTATLRSDGSSRFGANKRYGTFPSAAIGWRVSEEKFMKNVDWISNLKLRMSYGLSGNYNIGNYTYISNIIPSDYSFGGALAGGRVSSSIGNSDLTWEEASQLDAGIDLSILNDRLNLMVDVYRRITNGMLLDNEIPRSSGYTTQIVNLGKIRNQGVEIAVNSRNFTGAFEWSTSANISFNRNRVLALNENNDPILSGRDGGNNFTHKTEVGNPIGQFFGYILEGVYRDAEDLAKSPHHASSVPGSIKFRDVDGNGIIEPIKDFAVIGSPHPDFIWGLTNNFRYKGLDLNIILVGSQGAQLLKASNEYLLNIDGIFNVSPKVLNRWRSPENPGDGFNATTNGGTPLYRNVNSSWVESASFMRIQNITFGYTFNERHLQRSRIKSVRIYVSAQNLATFTAYSGANPDVSVRQPKGNAKTVVLVPGVDFTNYPIARSFNAGLNISF